MAALLYTRLIKWEKYFFLLLILAHLLPVLSVEFFVTLDGPARVYHSSLISRLLSGNTHASEYMLLNTEPVPYWTAQFLLSAMNQFFSCTVSEKILVGMYVVTFPLAFRKFILVVSAGSAWASYLIFPFIYSFLLYVGFYNFCLGLPVLFFALYIFLSGDLAGDKKKMMALSFLLLLLYFSHLFVLALFFIFTATLITIRYLFIQEGTPQRRNGLVREVSLLLLVSLPALLFSGHFLLANSGKQFFNSHLDFSELLEWLVTARPLVTYQFKGESPFALVIAIASGLLIIAMLYAVWKKKYPAKGNPWIIFCLLLLLLYFVLPNNLSTGGFVSMRLLLFFYLFLLVWFATGYFHPFLKGSAVVVFISISIYFLGYHRNEGRVFSEDAKEYYSVTDRIKDNSIVLPLDYSYNWMHNNLAAYLGTCRNIFILEDYDASSPHFPVMWKQRFAPTEIFGERFGDLPPCTDIAAFERTTGHKIDYITRWCFNPSFSDSCTSSINSKLDSSFKLIYVSPSGSAELFQRKK